MAPKGPILPRKDRTAAQARSAIENAAYQVGVLIAIQRNRWDLRQEDLADEVGCGQGDISAIERGQPPAKPLSAKQLARLFKALDLGDERELREFLMWWQSRR
jgi:ribosome-binding protein aMBF1 (putative translation factor)